MNSTHDSSGTLHFVRCDKFCKVQFDLVGHLQSVELLFAFSVAGKKNFVTILFVRPRQLRVGNSRQVSKHHVNLIQIGHNEQVMQANDSFMQICFCSRPGQGTWRTWCGRLRFCSAASSLSPRSFWPPLGST